MTVTRPVDILIRLQQITVGLEQGESQSAIMNEMKDLFAAGEAETFGYRSHVQGIMNLLNNPVCGCGDILEEIYILEEFLQTDEYGFREHQNTADFF